MLFYLTVSYTAMKIWYGINHTAMLQHMLLAHGWAICYIPSRVSNCVCLGLVGCSLRCVYLTFCHLNSFDCLLMLYRQLLMETACANEHNINLTWSSLIFSHNTQCGLTLGRQVVKDYWLVKCCTNRLCPTGTKEWISASTYLRWGGILCSRYLCRLSLLQLGIWENIEIGIS